MDTKTTTRIKDICGTLDTMLYGKPCHFYNDDQPMTFYSRDHCHNIDFTTLLKWYLAKIDYNEYEENQQKEFDQKNNLLFELIEIYNDEVVKLKLHKMVESI